MAHPLTTADDPSTGPSRRGGRLQRWFGTRDPRMAARFAITIMVPAAAVQTIYAVAPGLTATARWGSLVTVLVLLGGSGYLFRTDPARLDRLGLLSLVPLLGTAVLCTLNWVTSDTSAAAQVFVVLPTLWAASQLVPVGAWVVAAVSGVGNAALVLHLLPLGKALPDLTFVAATLALATALLTHAGNQQQRLVRALREQAAVDPLTGLVTRHVLDAALAGAVTAGTRPGTALVLVDVDLFKTINDVHGHPVGDDALRHLGAVLRQEVRDGDAVISRMGGDELAVLLSRCPTDVAERRARDLVEAVRSNPLPLADGGFLPLTISVGVAQAPTHASDVRSLYTAADTALYEAKRAGRDRAVAAGQVTAG